MESGGCLGPVTAIVCGRDGAWLVGIGTWLHLYEAWEVQKKRNLGHLVIGISIEDCQAVAWGRNHYSLFQGSTTEPLAVGIGSDWIQDIQFLPNCLLLAYAHDYVEVVTRDSFTTVREIRGPAGCLLYSTQIYAKDANSIKLACGTSWKVIYIWSTSDLKTVLNGHSGAVFRVRFNSSGSHLLSVSDDRTIKLWNLALASCELTLIGHTARVWDAGYVSELELFASIGEDCTLRIWRRADCIQTIEAHRGRNVWSLSVHPANWLILTGGQDGQVKQWNLREILNSVPNAPTKDSVSPMQFPMPGSETVLAMAVTSKYLFAGMASGRLYQWQRLVESGFVLIAAVEIAIVAMASTEEMLMIGDFSGLASFVDCEKGNVVATHRAHREPIKAIQVLPGSLQAWLSTDATGLAVLWQGTIETNRLNLLTKGLHCAIASDLFVYCGDVEGNLYVYRRETDKLAQFYAHLHEACISTLFLAENRLVSAGKDGKINVFHRTEGGIKHITTKKIEEYQGIEAICSPICLISLKSAYILYNYTTNSELLRLSNCSKVHCFHFSADFLSFCSIQESCLSCVCLPRPPSPVELTWTSGPLLHGREVLASLPLSLHGRIYLLTGSEDCTVGIYAIGSEVVCVGRMVGHPAGVRALATSNVSADEVRAVSGGGKRMLFLWEIKQVGEAILTKKLSSLRLPGAMEQRVLALDIYREIVAAGDSGGRISLLQVQSRGLGAQLTLLSGFSTTPLNAVLCLKLFQAGEEVYIAVGTTAGYISVHTVAGGLLVSQLKVHQLGVNCMSLSPINQDQVAILTGGDDESISISHFHQPNSLTLHTVLPQAHYSAVKAIAPMHASLLFSISWDGTLKLWSLPRLTPIACSSHFIGDCSCVSVLDRVVVVAGLGVEWFPLSVNELLV